MYYWQKYRKLHVLVCKFDTLRDPLFSSCLCCRCRFTVHSSLSSFSDRCYHCSQCCRSCCCRSCCCCRRRRHQSFCCCRRLCPRFKLHQFNFLLLLVWVMALNCFENEFLQVATPSTLTTSTTSATTITVVALLQKNYNNLLNNYNNIKITASTTSTSTTTATTTTRCRIWEHKEKNSFEIWFWVIQNLDPAEKNFLKRIFF